MRSLLEVIIGALLVIAGYAGIRMSYTAGGDAILGIGGTLFVAAGLWIVFFGFEVPKQNRARPPKHG